MRYTRKRLLYAQRDMKKNVKIGYNTHIQAVDKNASAYAAEGRCYIIT